jgi:hypothetical protein
MALPPHYVYVLCRIQTYSRTTQLLKTVIRLGNIRYGNMTILHLEKHHVCAHYNSPSSGPKVTHSNGPVALFLGEKPTATLG